MRTEDALFQLGMDLEAQDYCEPRSATQTEDNINNTDAANNQAPDHFVTRDGETFAGSHIIIDLYDAEGLDDQALIETAMLDCIDKAGATLLHIHLHPFEPSGVSGVAILAESHISVHTWPENGYAAFDIFMCGDARPEKCIDILVDAFKAGRVEVTNLRRGRTVFKG